MTLRQGILLAAAAGALAGVWRTFSMPSGAVAEEGLPAPDIRLTDITGQTAALTHYKGKVVLLDFWASWCDSCREELPMLKRIQSRYHPEGLEILAASVDEEGPRAVIPFAAQNKLPWRVLLADNDSAKAYGVSGLPTKYIIDRRGVVFRKYPGLVDEPTLEQDITEALRLN